MRNYTLEHQDTTDRLYAYNFDYIMHQYMMKTFQPWIKSGKALEMGCYKGEFTHLLTQHYPHVTVLEAASELIQAAKETVVGKDVTFIHTLFEQADLQEKFDAIFLIHTLEHLDDSITVLKKINHWLSDTGVVFLVVPNAFAASRQIAVKMGIIPFNQAVSEGEQQHGHRKTYSLDTLEFDAHQAGLTILHRGGIFFKAFANFQFDLMLKHQIINQQYLDASYALGMQYPELCASIFLVCGKGPMHV